MSFFEISYLFSFVTIVIMQPIKNNTEETVELLKDIDEYIASVTKERTP